MNKVFFDVLTNYAYTCFINVFESRSECYCHNNKKK